MVCGSSSIQIDSKVKEENTERPINEREKR